VCVNVCGSQYGKVAATVVIPGSIAASVATAVAVSAANVVSIAVAVAAVDVSTADAVSIAGAGAVVESCNHSRVRNSTSRRVKCERRTANPFYNQAKITGQIVARPTAPDRLLSAALLARVPWTHGFVGTAAYSTPLPLKGDRREAPLHVRIGLPGRLESIARRYPSVAKVHFR
jgi:hypothetical protein